ncbi:hypothetical protein B1L11_10005 [Microbispora sp. GKU 823]|nr:hypothetical protein B1L11_10005 [Microbispora sp. GKU 823]
MLKSLVVLVTAILGLGIAVNPASAATGGGCTITNVLGVWNISVCISYRGSDKMLLPDFYINSIVPQYSGHGEFYHEVLVHADGRSQVVDNVYTPAIGHNGPVPCYASIFGSSGSVRNKVELWNKSSGSGGYVIATAYSPWVNYP